MHQSSKCFISLLKYYLALFELLSSFEPYQSEGGTNGEANQCFHIYGRTKHSSIFQLGLDLDFKLPYEHVPQPMPWREPMGRISQPLARIKELKLEESE